MTHPLKVLLDHRRTGLVSGITSICTANSLVIEACMEHLKDRPSPLLIEATANQVNQDGGYTGMRPDDFREFIHRLADKTGFPKDRLFLGGDHLGPLTWVKLPEEDAMRKSAILVSQYVLAGFTKIHLDTSMRLATDDPTQSLSTETIAHRGIQLMKVAETAFQKRKASIPDAIEPIYVVGSEVPIPGGAQEEEGIHVTQPDDFIATIETYRNLMARSGLSQVWPRVLGIVVQPGVEFGDSSVHDYDPLAAKDLMSALKNHSNLVFEGHSTDYQTRFSLQKMVDDGIAILKVGPALTFALREGLFALAFIEERMVSNALKRSALPTVLDNVMLEDPSNWSKHYHGDDFQLMLKRGFSYSDRCRYYLHDPKVEQAIQTLMENTRDIPLSLLSQFMPIQTKKVRNGLLVKDPQHLVKDWVHELLEDYYTACERKPG